jgi:hypothetical protein
MRLMQAVVQGTFCTVCIGGKGTSLGCFFNSARTWRNIFHIPHYEISTLSGVPLTLDIGQIGTYLVPFRHFILLFVIFLVDSGVQLGHLGGAQPRKRGLKRATGSGSVGEVNGARTAIVGP